MFSVETCVYSLFTVYCKCVQKREREREREKYPHHQYMTMYDHGTCTLDALKCTRVCCSSSAATHIEVLHRVVEHFKWLKV